MDRDPSSLIDRWRIRRAYGSEYYDASSDSAQIILDPSQFNGYRSFDAGIEITLPSNEIVDLNFCGNLYGGEKDNDEWITSMKLIENIFSVV